MPVILSDEDRENAWLRSAGDSIEAMLNELCEPCSDSDLEAYPTLVNSPRNDSPHLVERT
jgi:putative SOS response-associated peptidase YedK